MIKRQKEASWLILQSSGEKPGHISRQEMKMVLTDRRAGLTKL